MLLIEDFAMYERYIRPAMGKIWSESNMYDQWLRVELAVCEAMFSEGLIPDKDINKIRGASYDISTIKEVFKTTRHDVNSFLVSVMKGLGDEGRWIHKGLTSNDVKDTGLGLQLVGACDLLINGVSRLRAVLREKALSHKMTLMMGRTHGIHAEPITLGLKLALWWEEMGRNLGRLERALDEVRIGKISGAVGTYAMISPSIEEGACKFLELKVDPISNQIVQRDRHANFIQTVALVAASLEKFAVEIRSLQRTEIDELGEPFSEGQTGSSAMPHKRNPELSERICGLARLLRGHSIVALENVALWNERDISHSSAERMILPDSCLALDYMLDVFGSIVKDLRVNSDTMIRNMDASHGLVFSQRVLVALIDKGLSRESAYSIVQNNAKITWGGDQDFRSVLSNDADVRKSLSEQEIDELFDYKYYLRHVDYIFNRLKLR